MVAIDVDTGKLKWYFQYTPHDTHDWDATQIPVLADLMFRGQQRKLLLHPNRNGFYYVLDRSTGEYLMAKPYVKQTWAKGIDASGRPILIPDTVSNRGRACGLARDRRGPELVFTELQPKDWPAVCART